MLGELQAEGSISISRREILLNQVGRLAEMIEMPIPKLKTSRDLVRKLTAPQPHAGGA